VTTNNEVRKQFKGGRTFWKRKDAGTHNKEFSLAKDGNRYTEILY